MLLTKRIISKYKIIQYAITAIITFLKAFKGFIKRYKILFSITTFCIFLVYTPACLVENSSNKTLSTLLEYSTWIALLVALICLFLIWIDWSCRHYSHTFLLGILGSTISCIFLLYPALFVIGMGMGAPNASLFLKENAIAVIFTILIIIGYLGFSVAYIIMATSITLIYKTLKSLIKHKS